MNLIYSFRSILFFSVYARLGDHIVLHGDRTGVVRYVGHLDRMGQSNLVYLGVHLDARGKLMTIIDFCENSNTFLAIVLFWHILTLKV